VAENRSALVKAVRKEVALFTGFLFLGLVVMPIAIYMVGQNIFGNYGGHGYGHFFGELSGRLRSGDGVAWFLVLSPYLGWQTLRLMLLGWRLTGSRKTAPR
jgi:hypothetical protein